MTGTITVTDPDGDGWVRVDPNGDAAAALVAARDGRSITTGFTVELDADGTIDIHTDVDVDVAVDVTGYYQMANPFLGASAFWPTDPELAAHSGQGTGVCDGAPCGTLAAGTTEVDVTGVDGYPVGGASAVTVSVLATTSGAAGQLRLAPNGAASAGEISWTSDFAIATGQFTVPVTSEGTIVLETSVATDVTVSVTGWWRAPTSADDLGVGLQTLDDGPVRLVDTRDGTGTCDGNPCDTLVWFADPVEVEVTGHNAVSDDAVAVVASVTVREAPAAGLLGVAPSPELADGVAIAFDTGDHAATITVPVDPATGAIFLGAWANIDVTIDIVGVMVAPTATWTYSYGTDGLRSAKQRAGSDPVEYTWSAGGGLPLLLAEHQGTQSSYLIYGPGGAPIYQTTKAGGVMYYHQDHQGSTRLTTNANGTARGTMAYDAYGQVTSNTNPWLQEQPLLGYVSQYHDTETGFIYLRARHYDPATGQFTSVDPLYASTHEPYGYAANNPANMVDPYGLWPSWDDVTSTVGDAWDATGGKAATWVKENPGTAATVVGVGVCVVSTLGACAAAAGGAFVVRSGERIQKDGFSDSLGANLADGALTYATFGLVSAPAWYGLMRGGGAAVPGVLVAGQQGVMSTAPLWQHGLARVLAAAPDIVGLLAGEAYAEDCPPL